MRIRGYLRTHSGIHGKLKFRVTGHGVNSNSSGINEKTGVKNDYDDNKTAAG